MTEPSPRLPPLGRDYPTLAAALLAFIAFANLGAPGLLWFDTGELAGAAWTLGISHPPGQPLHALLGKLAAFIPLGSIAFRINLLSAAMAAWALALLVRIAQQLWPRPGGFVAGLVAAATLGFNRGFVEQAVRAEVYTLALALILLAVHFTLRLREPIGQRRHAIGAALALGLAAGVHPLLCALAALPLAAAALGWLGPRPASRALPWATGAFVLGWGVHLYLPLRAAADPAIQFGDPAQAGGFWAMITGAAYGGNFTGDLGLIVTNLGGHLALLADLSSWPGLLIAVLGLALLWRRKVGLVLAGAIVLGLMAAVAQRRFYPQNPDVLGYLLPAMALLTLAAAGTVAAVMQIFSAREGRLGRVTQEVVTALVGLALIGLGAKNSLLDPAHLPHRAHPAADFAADLVDPVGPGPGLLVLESDHAIFGVWYDQAVRGARPDLAAVAWHLVGSTAHYYRRYLKRRHPWLFVPYVDDGGNRHRLRQRLVTTNAGRPVYAERPVVGGGLSPRRVTDCGTVFKLTASPGRCAVPGRFARFGGRIGGLIGCHIATYRAHYHLARGRPQAARGELRSYAASIRPGASAARYGAGPSGGFVCDPAEALALYGVALWRLGRRRQSRGVLRNALLIDPRQDRANVLLGQALAASGRLPQALERFEAATRGNSQNLTAWFFLGLAQHKLGRHGAARKTWQRAQKLDPEGFRRLHEAARQR